MGQDIGDLPVVHDLSWNGDWGGTVGVVRVGGSTLAGGMCATSAARAPRPQQGHYVGTASGSDRGRRACPRAPTRSRGWQGRNHPRARPRPRRRSRSRLDQFAAAVERSLGPTDLAARATARRSSTHTSVTTPSVDAHRGWGERRSGTSVPGWGSSEGCLERAVRTRAVHVPGGCGETVGGGSADG